MVMEVVHEEMAEGNMQCASHPYKNSSPGGVCAFCLQEKLGKLVSSSFPIAVVPPSSSSSSPSFRSEVGAPVSAHRNPHERGGSINRRRTARSRLPLRLLRKKKRQEGGAMGTERNCSNASTFFFMRSKSTVTPPGKALHFLDENHKRGFWSFLYSPRDSGFKKSVKQLKDSGSSSSLRENKGTEGVLVEENASPNETAVDRKVSRSRSIGCGSRSFSGDFFERISTGFSDCTLRRAESQREGKLNARPVRRNGREGGDANGRDCIKERVKRGRIFSGFIITSSSSSSSSSNWVSSSAEDGTVAAGKTIASQSHWRSRSWGWSLPSPMRAFGKPRSGKTDANSNNVPQSVAKMPSSSAVSC